MKINRYMKSQKKRMTCDVAVVGGGIAGDGADELR